MQYTSEVLGASNPLPPEQLPKLLPPYVLPVIAGASVITVVALIASKKRKRRGRK